MFTEVFVFKVNQFRKFDSSKPLFSLSLAYPLFGKVDFNKISHKELKKKYNELLEFLRNELFLYPEGHHIFSFGFLGFLLGCCLQSLSIVYMKNSF